MNKDVQLLSLSLSFFQVIYRFYDNKLQAVFFNDKADATPKLNSIYLALISKKQTAIGCYIVMLDNKQQAILKITKQNSSLNEGQKIMVQVVKEPTLPNKHAVVSNDIFFNYPLLKYKPFSNKFILSKHIPINEQEKIVTALPLENEGVVIRSLYKHNLLGELQANFLEAKELFKKLSQQTKVGLLYQPNFINNLIFHNAKLVPSEITLDTIEDITTTKKFLQNYNYLPTKINTLKENTKYSKEILLGYLNQITEPYITVNDQISLSCFETDSFNYIDVNYTGNFSTSKNKEEALHHANLIALETIASTIILKNLSGQIMVDVLKVTNKQYRNNLIKKLQHYFQQDDNKTTVLGFSNLGIVEIARQKFVDSMSLYSSSAFNYRIFKAFIDILIIAEHNSNVRISVTCNKNQKSKILLLAEQEVVQINSWLKKPLEFILIEDVNSKIIINKR